MRFKPICLTLSALFLLCLAVWGEDAAVVDQPAESTARKLTPTITRLDGQAQRVDLGDAVDVGWSRAFCEGDWQGHFYTNVANSFMGNETWITYQDPAETGCVNTYPFEVRAVMFEVFAWQPVTLQLQAKVYDYSEPDVIGAELYAGPVYEMDIPDHGSWYVELLFWGDGCVQGPYYAGVYCANYIGPDILEMITDDGITVPPRSDASYANRGSGWVDLVDVRGWPANVILWSGGLNTEGNGCEPIYYCGDNDNNGTLDISDLTYMVDYLFGGGPPPGPLLCVGDFDNDGSVNISDLTAFVDYLFGGGPPPDPYACNPPW